MEQTVSVIHLIGPPYNINLFKNFITSYKKYSAGCDHQLILLFNGIINEDIKTSYNQYADSQNLNYIDYNNTKEKERDLDAYFWISSQLTTDYILFLNSYTEFQSDSWLVKYMNALKKNKAGIVSATASYQSYYSTIRKLYPRNWEKETSFKNNYRKYKLLIKNYFLYRFSFAKFPNPHIRTNAFIINRELMQSIKYKHTTSRTKAYMFESGIKGFTKKIIKKGYKVLVVDKSGKTYEPSQWAESKTFWIANQENLLVSDNQTRLYDNASEEERKQMTYLAWGIK